jgi:tellurite resistance protein
MMEGGHMPGSRIPLNIFGIGFGLAGLATTWHVAADAHLARRWVSTLLAAVAAIAWAACSLIYARCALANHGRLSRDLRDMTAGPFASLALITPVLLAADGIELYSRMCAAASIDVLTVLIVALGGWFTGTWMGGGTDIDRLHPGYFLPTVAGGLVASAGTAQVGQAGLAEVLLGLGLICWLIFGSMILARLIFRPRLPDALTPTMAVEIAPAAVASLAYFSVDGGRIDRFAAGLASYGLLMIAAQLPLIPRYRSLRFSFATWPFAFSWAAVASTVLLWINAAWCQGVQLRGSSTDNHRDRRHHRQNRRGNHQALARPRRV